MTDKDLKKFSDLLNERLEATETRFDNLLNERLEATETRFDNLLNERLEATEKKIKAEIKQLSSDIADLINTNLVPQISEKADRADVDRTERKLDRLFDKDAEQDRRLDDIESIPVIAHDLRAKKS